MRSIVLGSLLIFSNFIILNGQSRTYHEKQIELIDHDVHVYLTLDIRSENMEDFKILISSYDLFNLKYSHLDITSEYPKEVLNLLEGGGMTITNTESVVFEKYKINAKCYKAISKKDNLRSIIEKYVDSIGTPMYSRYSKKRIRAVLAYLIDKKIMVYSGEYHEHNVEI